MKIEFSKALEKMIDKDKENCRNMRGEFLLKLNVEGFPFSRHLSFDEDIYKETKAILPYYKKVVVLGIGGSALGTRMIYRLFKSKADKELIILDTTDPMIIEEALSEMIIEDTVFVSISKSGATMETAALTMYFIEHLQNVFGEVWKNRMVFITDPLSGDLRRYVEDNSLHSLEIPSELGGRYSVLSNVGLFPLYLAGIDIKSILSGAKRYLKKIKDDKDITPFTLAGCNLAHYLKGKNILALFPYSGKMKLWGEWFIQLWGESLGKIDQKGINVGQTPIVAVGPTDQHSIIQLFTQGPNDKFVLFLDIENRGTDQDISLDLPYNSFSYLKGKTFSQLIDAELKGTRENLDQLGVATALLTMEELTEERIGELIIFSYIFTVYTAQLLGVDPFDQPGVEGGKKIMFKLLGRE